MLILLGLVLHALAFDAIIDLGCGTYQVGTLKKTSVGNPVEMILNSESKRHTPSLVAFDGEVFFVGEHAAVFQKRLPGLVFSGFTAGIMNESLSYAMDPKAPELSAFKDQPATTLLTALINHLVHSQINKPNETISVTLTIPPGLSLPEISAIRDAIEVVPNVRLLTTVPIPVATAITYLSSRLGTINRTAVSSMSFVVVDLGYHSTDVSIVEALFKPDSTDIHVRVVSTASLKIGGNAVTEALINKYVEPAISGFSLKADRRKYRRAYEALERSKITLSANTETHIVIESIMANGGDLHLTLTRDQLNAVLDELYNKDKMIQLAAIRDLIHEKYNSSVFYFYGAASRALHMQVKMEAFFNTSIQKTVNLDEGAIYGAALIAARYGSGHRVSYKFIPSDQTRPQLYYIPNRLTSDESLKLSTDKITEIPLMRLNPYQRKSINNDIFLYAEDEFILNNKTVTISLEKEVETEVEIKDEPAVGNETVCTTAEEESSSTEKLDKDAEFDVAEGEPFETEDTTQKDMTNMINSTTTSDLPPVNDDSSKDINTLKKTRKQKTISITPHNLTVAWISTKTGPFYQMNISAGDLLSINCGFYLPEAKFDGILNKYQIGSIVKEKDLLQLEKDLSLYNARVGLVLTGLKQYLTYPPYVPPKKPKRDELQDTRDIKVKFLVNITTDSASIPSISFAAIQIQNWTDYNKELSDLVSSKQTDKRPRSKVKAVDVEFERKCDIKLNSAFWADKEIFANGYKLIEGANKVLQNRNQLSHSVNEIETVIYAARDLLDKHPPSDVDEGDVLLYMSEGKGIVQAIESAKIFMEDLESKEPCGVNNTCVIERLTSTSDTVNALREAMKIVSNRLAQIRCVDSLREDFFEYINNRGYVQNILFAYSDLLAAGLITNDTNTTSDSLDLEAVIEKVATLNATMNSLSLSLSFNSSREQLKALRESVILCHAIENLDTDSLVKDYQDEEEQLEGKKLAAEKEQRGMSWFKRMLGKGGTDVYETEKKIIYAKDVIRRLKRAKTDCIAFNKTIERLKNKTNQVTELYQKALDINKNMTTEPRMRPRTNCTEVSELRTDLDKAIREARWQILHIHDMIKSTKIDTLTSEIGKMSDRAQNNFMNAKKLFKLMSSILNSNLDEPSRETLTTIDELVDVLRKLRLTIVSEKLLKYLKTGGVTELKEAGVLVSEPSEQTFEEYNSNVTSLLKKVSSLSSPTAVNSTNTQAEPKKEEL